MKNANEYPTRGMVMRANKEFMVGCRMGLADVLAGRVEPWEPLRKAIDQAVRDGEK